MRAGAGSGIAEDYLGGEEVFGRLHLRRLEGNTDIGFGGRRAEPAQLERIEAGAFLSGDWPERRVAGDNADHGAVLRCGGVDMRGGGEAAGAGHVLRHDRRIAWQMLADMARNRAAPQVIAAART